LTSEIDRDVFKLTPLNDGLVKPALQHERGTALTKRSLHAVSLLPNYTWPVHKRYKTYSGMFSDFVYDLLQSLIYCLFTIYLFVRVINFLWSLASSEPLCSLPDSCECCSAVNMTLLKTYSLN